MSCGLEVLVEVEVEPEPPACRVIERQVDDWWRWVAAVHGSSAVAGLQCGSRGGNGPRGLCSFCRKPPESSRQGTVW